MRHKVRVVTLTNGDNTVRFEIVKMAGGKFEHDCRTIRKSDLQKGVFFCDTCHATWESCGVQWKD